MKTEHMVRLSDKVYTDLVMKRAEFIKKFNTNYTMSEVIEVLLLEANMYEQK